MRTFVAIGRIAIPHGIRGWLKVEPLTDDPERFAHLDHVFVAGTGQEPDRYEIQEHKTQPRFVLLKLAGVDTREAADTLRGATVSIPEDQVPPAGEDEYYYYQLEGLRVETDSGEHLGVLDYIVRTGSNDVYMVRTPDGADHRLVPALKKGIKSIDLDRRLMIVHREWVL